MTNIIECGKFKGKKVWDKLRGNEKTSASLMADPNYIRYTVKHSIQGNVVRVTIYDNKVHSCAVRATGQYSYNPSVIISNKTIVNKSFEVTSDEPMFIDVDEPYANETTMGITMEMKIADAYVRLQATADKMNYENTKPYRIAEAVKKFEANKDVLTAKKS
jgi:hypothetical protein